MRNQKFLDLMKKLENLYLSENGNDFRTENLSNGKLNKSDELSERSSFRFDNFEHSYYKSEYLIFSKETVEHDIDYNELCNIYQLSIKTTDKFKDYCHITVREYPNLEKVFVSRDGFFKTGTEESGYKPYNAKDIFKYHFEILPYFRNINKVRTFTEDNREEIIRFLAWCKLQNVDWKKEPSIEKYLIGSKNLIKVDRNEPYNKVLDHFCKDEKDKEFLNSTVLFYDTDTFIQKAIKEKLIIHYTFANSEDTNLLGRLCTNYYTLKDTSQVLE